MKRFKSRKVLFEIHDHEITFRELLVMIIILCIFTVIGNHIRLDILNDSRDDARKYQQAIISEDADTFRYYMNTKTGYIFSEGSFNSSDTISSEYLNGKYNAIFITIEVYTLETYTDTEYYYEGNERKSRTVVKTRKVWKSVESDVDGGFSYFHYDMEIPYKKVKPTIYSIRKDNVSDQYKSLYYDGCIYLDGPTIWLIGDRRLDISYAPVSLTGTLFCNTQSTNPENDNDTKVMLNKTAQESQEYLSKVVRWDILFMVIWELVAFSISIGFGILENNYLED